MITSDSIVINSIFELKFIHNGKETISKHISRVRMRDMLRSPKLNRMKLVDSILYVVYVTWLNICGISTIENSDEFGASNCEIQSFIYSNSDAILARGIFHRLLFAKSGNRMERFSDLESFPKCRLCGVNGLHEIDILENNARGGSNDACALSEKIFRCVGIHVSNFHLESFAENKELMVCSYDHTHTINRSKELIG